LSFRSYQCTPSEASDIGTANRRHTRNPTASNGGALLHGNIASWHVADQHSTESVHSERGLGDFSAFYWRSTSQGNRSNSRSLGSPVGLTNVTRRPDAPVLNVQDDAVFEALGTIDELASFVGQAREECTLQGCSTVAEYLESVLATLLDVGASVATPLDTKRLGSDAKRARTSFASAGAAAVNALEGRIDMLAAELPPLTTFILVSGGRAATALHVARTVCRRAERRCVRARGCEAIVVVFLNRLSDYLFVAARWVAADARAAEVTYQPGGSKPRGVSLVRPISTTRGGTTAITDAATSYNPAEGIPKEIVLAGAVGAVAAIALCQVARRLGSAAARFLPTWH